MATPDVVASSVMDSAAALLNDTQKQVYTYATQLPYLKIALLELRELLELNNTPITNETSEIIIVPAGTSVISFVSTPALPNDLVEIQQLWERYTGIEPFVPMVRKEFLPHYLEGEETDRFLIFQWADDQIQLLAANRDNDLKIDYIKQLFPIYPTQNSIIGVINSESFLFYRTAALCAEFVGENKTRADELNAKAESALDRSFGIESKARQSIATRHRPFRAGWKSRGMW
jgi:hypothetical protein